MGSRREHVQEGRRREWWGVGGSMSRRDEGGSGGE